MPSDHYTKVTASTVNNTESDITPAQNITHLCQQAWENVSTVKVALGGDITLQIVPMSLDKSYHPYIIAIVLSDVVSKENRTRPYEHEEMMNVTCLVNTWEEETYQHVFTAPLSSTPDGTVCVENTQATGTPDSTLFTREGMPLTTIEPKMKTTKLALNQTTYTCSPCPNGTVKERSPHVAIIIMGTVIGVVLVELLVVYVIRRQRCCTATQEPPPAAPSPNCWMMGGPGPLAGARGTAPNRTTQQSAAGEQQYSEIPDEYYNQQNTATSTTLQTDHDYSQIPDEYYNYYNTIPDEYYNRYNTYPPTRQVPQDDKDYSVRLNTAAAEVVLPSSTRLGDKHPSYDTAPQVWRDPQNYQIPARGRQTNIRSHSRTGNSGHQYMGLLHCRYNRRLSYPQTLCVAQDDKDYSVRFNTAAAEVVLPSSTRLGDKHPSYDTAPQVWRDPQNYQNPVSTRLGNKHPSYDTAPQVRRDPQNYQNPVSTRLGDKHPSYDTAPQVRRDPQNYQNPVSTRLGDKHPSYDTAPQVRRDPQNYQNPVSTRLGDKHPSYDTAPQVWRDPQNYQIPARGRNTNIRSHRMPVARSNSEPRYMGLIGNYSKTTTKFRKQKMPLYNNPLTQPNRHQINTKYQSALKAEHPENSNHPNMSHQQASKGVITISQGDALARFEGDSKGQVHRSQTLGMDVSKLEKESHRRQSI
ncbi:regulation of response to stimulus [Branchiostoma belcheri]|nr:regulation of response to stimulus [Branchiostoma belcheri]